MAYTAALDVRKALLGILYTEDDVGEIESGTHVALTAPALDVPTILKDATTLTKDTDYTFVRPDKITLGVAATGENFIAQCSHGVTDTVLDEKIAAADRIIDDYFAQMSSAPASANAGDWSKWLAGSFYLSDGGIDLDRAKELYKRAMDAMKEYRKNTLDNMAASKGGGRIFVKRVNG